MVRISDPPSGGTDDDSADDDGGGGGGGGGGTGPGGPAGRDRIDEETDDDISTDPTDDTGTDDGGTDTTDDTDTDRDELPDRTQRNLGGLDDRDFTTTDDGADTTDGDEGPTGVLTRDEQTGEISGHISGDPTGEFAQEETVEGDILDERGATPEVRRDARQLRYEIAGEQAGVRREDISVDLVRRDGQLTLVPEISQAGRRRGTARQFDEQTQTDITADDLIRTDSGYRLSTPAMEEEREQAAAGEYGVGEEDIDYTPSPPPGVQRAIEEAGEEPTTDGFSLGGGYAINVGTLDSGERERFESEIEENVAEETGLEVGEDFNVTTEDGEPQVGFTEGYFERRLTEQLDIAADAGEDFTIEQTDDGQSVELTAEGRQDAITSQLLSEGEVEVDRPGATIGSGTRGGGIRGRRGEGGELVDPGEREDIVIGGGTRTIEIESAEQLEFDEEGDLTNVTPPPGPTFEEEVEQIARTQTPIGEFGTASAVGLAGSRQLLRGAADISTDVGTEFGQRVVDPSASFAEDVGDVVFTTGQAAGATFTGRESADELQEAAAEQTVDVFRGESGEALRAQQPALGGLVDTEREDIAEATDVGEQTGEFTRGVGSIAQFGIESPDLAYRGSQAIGEAGAFTVEDPAAAPGAAADTAVNVGEQIAVQTINEPVRTAGMLVGSAGIFGAARAVGPRTSLATRAAIQPGEEILGYGGYGLTRRVAGQRAADRLFPYQEPLIFSEEAAILTAQRAGGAARRAGEAIRGGEIPRPSIRSRIPVEVEAGRNVAQGRVDVNVRSGLTDTLVRSERRGSDVQTRLSNRIRRERERLAGEDVGGEYTPLDLAEPVFGGVESGVGAARRATQIPFEAFARARTGARNIGAEFEAFEARGAEGMSDLVEESRSAARDVRESPSLRQRASAELRGDIDTGDPSFRFDTESGDYTPLDLAEPVFRGVESGVGVAGRIARAPVEGARRVGSGVRQAEIQIEALEARGTEGVSDLVGESRSAARDVRESPSLRQRASAELRGDVDTGEPSFLFDTRSTELTAADVLSPVTGAPERIRRFGSAVSEFGVRVDIGKPGRTARASELDIDDPVGTSFEGEFDTEGELFEPAEGMEQPTGPTEFGGGLESFRSDVEVETESGVAVQRVIGRPEIEVETERETETIREAAQPRRFEIDLLEDEQPLAPELRPEVDALGVGVGELEGEREALAFEPVFELEGRGELEREQELEREAELEQELELEREQELERELELELETEAERELELEGWPDDQLQDRERDPMPFLGDTDDVITEFRNPLTGELIETEREPTEPSLPFL